LNFALRDHSPNYQLFFRFIEKYSPSGFIGIDADDPLIIELEEMMEKNDQFFYLADLIRINIIYTSKRSEEMMGIEPKDLSLYHFYDATHPDDIKRNSLGRATSLKLANDLFVAEKGWKLLSTTLRIKNPEGQYNNLLMQLYLFYSSRPYKTVYLLKVHTNIDWSKNIKNCYHYYLGEDLSYFKYPDPEMLKIGNVFSKRELEIIRLIGKSYNSDQIAEQLFLSPHTVNTHRRNILNKTGMSNMSELIYDLMERGLL
jgi:DNA-binding CsgD family transcriptional regulator